MMVLGVASLTGAATPRRIVSFSPALTEMLFAIGAGERVVGVSDFCTYPPETATRTRMGGTANPNLELLLTLKPDLVLVQGVMDHVQRFCRTYGIACSAYRPDDFAGITNTLQELGMLTGTGATAAVVRAALAARWDAVRTARAHHTPVPAFVCLYREPARIASFTTAGARSFIIEALEAAGGSNVCRDVAGSYPTVALELIVSRQPRVIFDILPPALSARQQRTYLAAWREVRGVAAARSGHVVAITNACALIPGPRMVELAEEFSRALRAMEARP